MSHVIYPLLLARAEKEIDLSHWLYRKKPGETTEWGCGVFLILTDGGEFILVDAGVPSREDCRKYGLPAVYGERSDIRSALERIKVRPDMVKKVILTNLLWDHCWELSQFPGAEIYVQREEVRYAIYPQKYEFSEFCLFEDGPRWNEQILQFHPLNGDKEIVPGVQVLATPGRTPGGQSVVVQTSEGKVALVGEFAHRNNTIRNGPANATFTSLKQWYIGQEKLSEAADLFLCSHDLSSYERSQIR